MASAAQASTVALDPAASEVVRLAAWIGKGVRDEVFVSYATLLIALLFTPSGNAPWQEEARRLLNLDALLNAKVGLGRAQVERVTAEFAAGALTAFPEGRDAVSVSAQGIMARAMALAARRAGQQVDVRPADLMASYLLDIPSEHGAQAKAWGLTAPAATQLGERLVRGTPAEPEAPTASGTAATLPGYDTDASTILRLAFALARRRRNEKRPLLASETLLVALTEGVTLVPERQAAPLAVLRGMLRAGEPGSDFARRRDFLFEMPAEAAAALAGAPQHFPPLSNNMQAVLRTGRDLARRVSHGDDAGSRHLLAALISEADGTDRAVVAGEWLRGSGVDTDALREALARVIGDRFPQDDQAAWRELLIGRDLPVLAAARPDVIPDDPRSEDRLGLSRYANALGALVAAREQQPPLSIAVFGPWGSGKSFFMRMVRAAVRDFAGGTAATAATPRPAAFLQHVVQIEFNAWTYAAGNLWASLVHAILVGLQEGITRSTGLSAFEKVLIELHAQQSVQLEAEIRLREAEQRLEEARAAEARAEEEATAKREAEAQATKPGDILRAVQEETLAALHPPGQAGDAAWIGSVVRNAQAAAAYLGRPELAAGLPALGEAAQANADATRALQVKVGEIQALLDEVRATAGSGLAALGWLSRAEVTQRGFWWTVVASAGSLLLFLLLARQVAAQGNAVAATASSVAAFLAPLATTLGAAIAWARRHLATATRAFSVLGSLRDRIEALKAERIAANDAALEAARRATAAAEAEAVRRRAEAQAAQAAVARAEAEVKAATSSERLKRFVAQRLQEGDYERHLGLIHTIRGDLEKLRDILRNIHPAEAEHGGGPLVERIVLYIDDLDRCPPAKVVEVLEAVHLLLAFDLFVVVVGVDIRWVAQALRERYPMQLGDQSGIASPTDYLEKVFQIPFWLPAMDPGGGRRLLQLAVEPPVAAAVTVPAGAAPAVMVPASVGIPPGAPALPAGGEAPAMETVSPPPAAPDSRAAAEALVLGPAERDRLLDMAEAVGASPRRAKRFANLYRLLKASLSPAERRGFVLEGGQSGSYEAALILLAAATGAPRATGVLAAGLQEPVGPQPDGWLRTRFDSAAGAATPEEKRAFQAAAAIALAKDDRAALARDLAFWAPRISRFAFHASLEVEPPVPAKPPARPRASRRRATKAAPAPGTP